jgi:hypothetical protein
MKLRYILISIPIFFLLSFLNWKFFYNDISFKLAFPQLLKVNLFEFAIWCGGCLSGYWLRNIRKPRLTYPKLQNKAFGGRIVSFYSPYEMGD